jgi:hypothetical protein
LSLRKLVELLMDTLVQDRPAMGVLDRFEMGVRNRFEMGCTSRKARGHSRLRLRLREEFRNGILVPVATGR